MNNDNFFNNKENNKLKKIVYDLYIKSRFNGDYETWYNTSGRDVLDKDSKQSWNNFIDDILEGDSELDKIEKELIKSSNHSKSYIEDFEEDIEEYLSDIDLELYEKAKLDYKEKFNEEYDGDI